MAESHCLFCQGDVATNSCFCNAMERVHLETLQGSPLGLSDPQPFPNGHQDEWTTDVDLGSLYNGQFGFLSNEELNPIAGFQDVVRTIV